MLVLYASFVVFLPFCASELFEYRNLDKLDILYKFISDRYLTEEFNFVDALEKVLNFFYSDFEHVNMDGLLGLIITEGQLNVIIQKLHLNHVLFDKILELQQKCHHLINLIKSIIKISSNTDNKILNSILQTKLWEIDSPLVKNSLDYLTPFNWTFTPTDILINHVFFDGSPNGKESEACMIELIDLTKHFHFKKYDCIPSEKCAVMMSQLDKSHGYPLTHKLLYVQIARALKCKLNKNGVKKYLNVLCTRILQEFHSIEKIAFKEIVMQDLYIEQMVLCGLEGFTEFLAPKSRQNLIQWQSVNGCYGEEKLNNRWREKRETSRMKFGCESHITGLAAAAIALNINYLISVSSYSAQNMEDTHI